VTKTAELAARRDKQGGVGAIGLKFGVIVREDGEGIFEMREAIERTLSLLPLRQSL
jgi:hypothetical protein